MILINLQIHIKNMLYKYTVNSLSLEARNYILNSIYSSTKKNDIKKNIYIYIYIYIL